MQRRTFLTSSLLGAAFAAAPATGLFPAATATAAPTVSTLADLQRAIDAAAPGDRIVLANGTYTVPTGSPLRISGKNGTSAAPITIVSESRGGAVLQGERGFVLSDSSHIVLSGFAFRQRTTLEIPASCRWIRLTRNDFRFTEGADLDWVVVRGDDVKVDRNHFHDKAAQGIFLVLDGSGSAVAQRLHVFRNHFARHSYTGDNGGEAIRLGDSARALADANAIVEYNLFERCDGDPEAVSVKSSANLIRYNTLHDSVGGIVLRHGNGSTVEGNHLVGGTNGIRIYGNDHLVLNNHLAGLTDRALVIGSGTTRDHHPGETAQQRRGNDACDRAVIAHNTLVDNKRTISGESRTHGPRDVVLADNLLVASSGTLVSLSATSGFTWQSNLLWGAAANGDIPQSGFFRADPRLQQGTDGVYRLTPSSPAIGAATLTGTSVTEDADGHPRGTTRDIGADEYTTAAPLRRPLTATDVGPNAS
ncbi:polysaccharide lyase 6 family protein [Streptomyces sp. JNUCC 64]